MFDMRAQWSVGGKSLEQLALQKVIKIKSSLNILLHISVHKSKFLLFQGLNGKNRGMIISASMLWVDVTKTLFIFRSKGFIHYRTLSPLTYERFGAIIKFRSSHFPFESYCLLMVEALRGMSEMRNNDNWEEKYDFFSKNNLFDS